MLLETKFLKGLAHIRYKSIEYKTQTIYSHCLSSPKKEEITCGCLKDLTISAEHFHL